MVNEQTVLTTIHVLAAVLWIGGGFALNVTITRAFRSGDSNFQLNMLKTAEFIGQRIFIPLALILLGAGIWLTADYYDFSVFWINYGIAGFVITFCIGTFYLGPTSGRLAERLQAGEDQVTIRSASKPLVTVARIDLLVLLSVICMMVIKPT